MKYFVSSILLFALLSCGKSKPLVDAVFMDSVLNHYTPSKAALTNEADLQFWKSRIDTLPESFVNQEKYASALSARFHIFGNIQDLKKADSIMQKLNIQFQEKDPGVLLHLASYSLLQHRFQQAGTYINKVIQMKAKPYAAQMMLFDADFESGNYYEASTILKNNRAPKDYAYNFRLSKQEHYSGSLDSAVNCMLRAADVANANPYLKQAALTNAADLYVHAGKLQKAAALYQQSILFNACDFHSLMGLGWIALVYDKNDSLATKIFKAVHQKIQSPDALLKLSQAAELKNNAAQKEYAEAFVQQAGNEVYGNMYNKYLIQLYTGVLHKPQQALAIAQKEIENRATPQTYAWLAWCYFYNKQPEEAYRVYEAHVSGKPLEALELYWMGKMMKGIGKGYNAQEFLKAAQKNKYDLSPAAEKDLEETLQ